LEDPGYNQYTTKIREPPSRIDSALTSLNFLFFFSPAEEVMAWLRRPGSDWMAELGALVLLSLALRGDSVPPMPPIRGAPLGAPALPLGVVGASSMSESSLQEQAQRRYKVTFPYAWMRK
jgi:hypothetical protein